MKSSWQAAAARRLGREFPGLTYLCIWHEYIHMRTTVLLADELLRKAKKKAAEDGRTLTSMIEEGLRVLLAEPKPARRKRYELPISKASGGVMPGIDLNNSADLLDKMEGR